jgi:hypothetical protein
MMTPNLDRDPEMIMSEARRGLRAVGLVFTLLGIIELLILVSHGSFRSEETQIAIASAALMLIGPGAWYLIAAATMQHRQFTLIRPCIWIGVIQSALAVGIIVAAILLPARFVQDTLLLTAVLTIFFVPAVFACVAAMRRAERLTHLFIPEGKAFHPIDVRPSPRIAPPSRQPERPG